MTDDDVRLAYLTGEIGAVIWHITQDRLVVDEHAENLFGLHRGTFGATFRDLLSRVREESRDALADAMEHVLVDRSVLDVELRVTISDGTIRTLRLRGTILHDNAGQPSRLLASVADVSALAAARADTAALREELAKQADALQRARTTEQANSRAMSALLANLSRELRTRLTGILGATRLLVDGELAAEHRELASTILSSSGGLLDITADLIDVAVVDRPSSTDVTTVDIRALVTGALAAAATAAQAKAVALSSRVDDSVPLVVHADGRRLRRVLDHLLDSAIARTLTGEVAVIASAAALDSSLHELVVEVRAGGHDVERGEDLALALAGKLTTLVGGMLAIRAEPDHGSTARLTIPVDAADQPAPASADDSIDPTLGGRHPLRILVAEDNPINSKVIGAFLARLGYSAHYARDGRQALDILERDHFDLVLMDIQMPLLDGLEATRLLRRRVAREHGPRVVALTANALPHDRAACFKAGCDEYLTKPVTIEALAAALRACQPVVKPALETGVLDPTVLASLGTKIGAKALAEMVSIYETDACELLAALQAAVGRDDVAGVVRAARSLSWIAATLGAGALQATCDETVSASEHTVGDALDLTARAARELISVRAALADLIRAATD